MDNTFTRALIGFLALTAGLSGMSLVALKALTDFAGAPWWAMLLIIAVALVAEISIYSTTLHEPIIDWIKEPKRRAERDESNRKEFNMGYEAGKRDAGFTDPLKGRQDVPAHHDRSVASAGLQKE